MDSVKPWYLSRTIWASAIAVASTAASFFGMSNDGLDGGALTDSILQAVTAISGIVAILGRLGATTRIG